MTGPNGAAMRAASRSLSEHFFRAPREDRHTGRANKYTYERPRIYDVLRVISTYFASLLEITFDVCIMPLSRCHRCTPYTMYVVLYEVIPTHVRCTTYVYTTSRYSRLSRNPTLRRWHRWNGGVLKSDARKRSPLDDPTPVPLFRVACWPCGGGPSCRRRRRRRPGRGRSRHRRRNAASRGRRGRRVGPVVRRRRRRRRWRRRWRRWWWWW